MGATSCRHRPRASPGPCAAPAFPLTGPARHRKKTDTFDALPECLHGAPGGIGSTDRAFSEGSGRSCDAGVARGTGHPGRRGAQLKSCRHRYVATRTPLAGACAGWLAHARGALRTIGRRGLPIAAAAVLLPWAGGPAPATVAAPPDAGPERPQSAESPGRGGEPALEFEDDAVSLSQGLRPGSGWRVSFAPAAWGRDGATAALEGAVPYRDGSRARYDFGPLVLTASRAAGALDCGF